MEQKLSMSVVICGVKNADFDIIYSVKLLREIFPNAELILSSNDSSLTKAQQIIAAVDKVIDCDNYGHLPSLKFPAHSISNTVNNNINKQIASNYAGINAASGELVLKLRTDQILFNDDILSLWELIESVPVSNSCRKGRIITSSVFSINPRYSERMPFHISDMMQFGYRQDLLHYYSAPQYTLEYAVWYEKNPHHKHSNFNERSFRSLYAVEQWLALHYIYNKEEEFPVRFHNDFSTEIIENFESILPDYFIIAHPDDIGLRISKFESARSYFNTQCYSTYESIELLKKANPDLKITNKYFPKGIDKKKYKYVRFFLEIKVIQLAIKIMPADFKSFLKSIIA